MCFFEGCDLVEVLFCYTDVIQPFDEAVFKAGVYFKGVGALLA